MEEGGGSHERDRSGTTRDPADDLTAGAATGERAARSAVERTMGWIDSLASEIGPRRPTGSGERVAAEFMRAELERAGVGARIESFEGYSTFSVPYGLIFGAAVAPVLIPRRLRRARATVALAGGAGLATEGGLIFTPLSGLLSRRKSQNVVATIEPTATAIRTVCLVCHLDSSRSGLMFHPAMVRYLNRLISAESLAVLVQSAEPLLSRAWPGRAILGASRALLAVGLLLLVERELRGEDVPGANDNASGAAVAAQLAAELAADPPEHTRIVLLMTGCEESGLLGAQAFLRSRDTSGWLFVNFDSVGGAAPLRYLRREGVIMKWDADPGLIALADRLSRDRPELGLSATDRPAGLTYDVSPVLARGQRAITFSAQDDTIPNLHRPTDTYENVDRDVVERTLEVGREMVAAIDRGEADS